jgi:hypothetical protein
MDSIFPYQGSKTVGSKLILCGSLTEHISRLWRSSLSKKIFVFKIFFVTVLSFQKDFMYQDANV